ncbi:hypothetical protein CRI94_12770 [Longibacter salinarum]|uniref:PAS domain-containing protein n=1 Tax=Longibacter salinarum TaxID=1850348 RepID=A0A2A8CW92_9BACT|nr:PAS domain-containing protein [Longibacter salinarum]PEN12870.1 hypothetical protein CRI94_12770 [Longibacter salinarum]
MSSSPEKIIDALLQALEGAVLVCTAEGTILQADRTAQDWFGAGAAPGGSILDTLAHGEARTWFEHAQNEERDELPFSSMVVTNDGRWVEATLHPAEDDEVVLQLKTEMSSTDAAPVPHEVLRDLIETMREPLASVRAAAETMALYPSMDRAATTQFMSIVEEQTAALSDRLDAAVAAYARLYRRAGPLHPIHAGEFTTALAQHLDDNLSIDVSAQPMAEEVDARLLLDAQAITESLTFLANRIENAARCTALRVSVERVRSLAALDLSWEGGAVTSARIREWEQSTITWGDSIIKMTLAEILDHNDAQMIIQTDHGDSSIRLLLPISDDMSSR